MINRPTDKEKVDRYAGQLEHIGKQLYRLTESMTTTLDVLSESQEERRMQRMLSRVIEARNLLDPKTLWSDV